MFQRFLNFIKGVMNKMFKNGTLKDKIQANIAISSKMIEAIELFENIYENRAPWLKKDEIESLEIGSAVANEFTRLTTLEMKSEITGSPRAEFLNEIYEKEILKNLNENLEAGNAVGGLIFKPFVKNGKMCIDFIKSDSFYPLEFNSSGNITAAIFASQIIKGEDVFTRLEQHSFYETPYADGTNYVVTNRAFKSKDPKDIGDPINLSQVDEWANLEEITRIKHIEKPLFSYYRPPIANNIDPQSPLGISVFARAIPLIKQADKQFGRAMWEYEASEKAVYVDELATKKTTNNPNGSYNVEELKGRIYKKLNRDEDFFEAYSPDIRDEAFWRGLNKILQRIEFVCGLAYGTLSEPNTVDKTAEEIKMSKQRSYATVCKMQENLQDALEDLIYAMDVLATLYHLAPFGIYETSYEWDDSLIVDADREQTLQMQEVNNGLRRRVKYLEYRYGLTEEQAEEEYQKIEEERKARENSMGQFPGEE